MQWQVSSTSGATWTTLSDSTGQINGSATDTLTVQTASNLTQNGNEFRALLQSSAGSTFSTVVTMTVLPTESVLTALGLLASRSITPRPSPPIRSN